MEQVTTYRTKGKEIGLTMLFKYDLNGYFKSFEIADGNIVYQQSNWFFAIPPNAENSRFPITQEDFVNNWLNSEAMKSKFDITESPPDLSFETLWEIYEYKHDKIKALKAFNKLNEADKIKLFISIPHYNAHLAKTGQSRAYLATYINNRRFDDEYPTLKDKKNFNPALADIAKKKTKK